MKSLSFRDLQLIPELSGFNEVELLYPHMDSIVNKYLAMVGVDTEFPVEYIPSVHRDLQGVVALGFRCVGEISTNRNDINSVYCTLEDRLVAASYSDISLMEEMSSLAIKSPDYNALADSMCFEEPLVYLPQNILEDDWEFVEAQINELYELRDKIRGSAYNSSGALKMPDEYEEVSNEIIHEKYGDYDGQAELIFSNH